jgi:hypothetical protein
MDHLAKDSQTFNSPEKFPLLGRRFFAFRRLSTDDPLPDDQ